MRKEGWFQVGLGWRGDENRPVTDLDTARRALADVTGTKPGDLGIEAVQAEVGVWNVELPVEMADQLLTNRYLGIENPEFTMEAEWP